MATPTLVARHVHNSATGAGFLVLGVPKGLLLANSPVLSMIRSLHLAFPLMSPFPEPAATGSERRFSLTLIGVLAIVGLTMQWVWVSNFLAAAAPSVRYP